MENQGASRTLQVLVADDDPVVRKTFSAVLEDKGHQVMLAGDGLAALEMATTARPDLIFLDIIMPHLDGLQTLEKLRAQPATREIPVVVVTARSDTATLISALEAGADDFLCKPFTGKEVLGKIRFVLLNRIDREERVQRLLFNLNPENRADRATEQVRLEFWENFDLLYFHLLRLFAANHREGLEYSFSHLLSFFDSAELEHARQILLKLIAAQSAHEEEKCLNCFEELYMYIREIRRSGFFHSESQ